MSLPRAGIIQSLIVDCSPGGTIVLGCDVHPALPGHGGVQGNLFNHTQADVTLQALLHRLFPVDGHDSRALDSNRFHTGVYVEF